MKPLVLTLGEPAGIGPDLAVLLAQKSRTIPMVVVGDGALLEARARLRALPLRLEDYDPSREAARRPGVLTVLDLPLPAPVAIGRPDPANAATVLAWLDRAIAGCLAGEFAGLVTGPVHKSAINDAGIPFQGHTEYLQQKSGAPHVVMMLAGANMRVALATTHHALKDVPAAITPARLTATLRVLDADLVRYFTGRRPRILVAGLNPHAGEGGHLGREEIDIIAPVLASLMAEGLDLAGPLPADTLFTRENLARCDVVLAMYHDQGLPVLKYASFGEGVNITLGLPFVRTSVDHGTALDLAGTGRIHTGSLEAAAATAAAMARHAES